jgi:hypothetical protein
LPSKWQKDRTGPDLRTLAISKDGTKTNVQRRINVHFDAHPRLKEDPKYMGLFVRGTRGQKRPAQAISNDKNSPPNASESNASPSNRPHHNAEASSSMTVLSRNITNATPHNSYYGRPFVPNNHTHHLEYGPYHFHGPPLIFEGTHSQPPAALNLHANSLFPVYNNHHYIHPSS